ncbi:MAG TPA: GatB/YqeY domain-containing protein [Candidatus Polarisedimenticolia bacterium]|nr:GatB/YqeY domain-containing protein [Candidatus Polarisedimenticolia bacterium]
MIDTLKNDLKDAMRRADAVSVGTLRMLISQFQYARIQAGHDLTEEEAIAVLQRAVKTRRESIEQFQKAGRAELAAKEEAEIGVVERYLPKGLNPDEVGRAIDALLSELGITEKRDLGRAMKEFMARHRGKVDGKAVNALIAARLK